MKVVCVALLLFVLHQSFTKNVTIHDVLNRWKEQVAPFDSECIAKSGVEQKLLDEFYKDGKISDNYKFTCYLYCHGDKAHIYDCAGKINPKMVQHFDYVDSELAQKCAKVEAKDLCRKAYLMENCVFDDLSKRYPSVCP